MLKKIAWVVAILLLSAGGFLGLLNAFREMKTAASTLQLSVGIAQVVYGFGGIAAAGGLAMRRRWSVIATAITSVAMTWAASIASFAYSDPQFQQSGTAVGVASAFGSTLLMSWFFIWTARTARRKEEGVRREERGESSAS